MMALDRSRSEDPAAGPGSLPNPGAVRSAAALTLAIATLVGGALWEASAQAYPVLLEAKGLGVLLGAERAHLAAYVPEGAGFKRVPVQVDEVEDGAAIVFRAPTTSLPSRKDHAHPSTRDPFGGRLDDVHRVAIDDELFGPCDDACARKAKSEARRICGVPESTGVNVVRVDLSFRKTSAFLVDCRRKQKADAKAPIRIDLKERTFSAEDYSYTYKDKRNILFDNIALEPEGKPVLRNGELLVYLKPKYVFNMQFGEKDLVSRVTSVTQGPVSTGVEVAFSLDVLSFKVNSQICCDVSLYKDSLYFPVMLDLPFEGSSFKPGSGLFYGFDAAGDPDRDVTFLADRLKDHKFVEARAPRAGGSSAILVRTGDKIIAVGFRSMKAEKAKAGETSAPLVAFKDDLKRIEFPDVNSRFGLFYDVTALAKGFHHFNVWFYVGGKEQEPLLAEYARNGIRYEVSPVH